MSDPENQTDYGILRQFDSIGAETIQDFVAEIQQSHLNLDFKTVESAKQSRGRIAYARLLNDLQQFGFSSPSSAAPVSDSDADPHRR